MAGTRTYPIKFERAKLQPGDRGVTQTIALMRRYARNDAQIPEITAIAKRAKRKSSIATLKALYNYVIRKHAYRNDPKQTELVRSPRHMVTRREHRAGDCDDLSTLLAALLLAAGYRTAYKVIAWDYKRGRAFTHVYVLVYLPDVKRWMPLDPVMKTQGFGRERAPIIRRRVYPI